MAIDDVSTKRKVVTHVLLSAVGISMLLPFLWMLSTSLKSESEVMDKHHVPRAVILGEVDGEPLFTVDGDPIYEAIPVRDDDGLIVVRDGEPVYEKGEQIDLRLGNPTFQGSKGDRAVTIDGRSITDDEGVPVPNGSILNNADMTERLGGDTRFRDPRQFDKHAEPVLIPRDSYGDHRDAENERLAKAYFDRYVHNWEGMIAARWDGMVPLMITQELADAWSDKTGKPEPVTIDGRKLRDPRIEDRTAYYQFRQLSWGDPGSRRPAPVRNKRRPAKVVTDDGIPIDFAAPFPLYTSEDGNLKRNSKDDLVVFVGNEAEARRISGREVETESYIRFLWSNYATVFADRNIKMSLFAWNSLFVAIVTVALKLFTSALAAFAFARLEWPGRDKIFFAYLATMMIPGIVTTIPNYMILKEIGWLNSFAALIIPGAATAYGTFMLRQFMLTLPKGLEEAALIDGASLLRVWWDVVLPLCKPALITLAIFVFSGTWQAFTWPLIVAPDEEVRVLAVSLKFFSDARGSAYNLLMAASLVMMIPMLLLFIFGQKYFIKGIQLGGIKE